MQTQGSLQESSLASLLQTMQTERATGALALESDDETASLYFLFGHLFHADGAGGQGEDVVLSALSWQQGSFRFNPRAKLPPEETIKSSPADLIAEAERRSPGAGPSQAPAWQPGPAPYAAPEPAQYENPTYDDQPAPGYPWPAPATQAPAPDYSAWSAPVPEPTAPPPAYAPPSPYPFGREPAPAETPRYQQPVPAEAPRYQEPAPVEAPRYQQPAPAPAPAAPEPSVLGARAVPPLDIVYPLPAGRAQYQGLKSAFVDFPKLLRTLRGDQQTGYVRLSGGNFSGMLLFHKGRLLEALSSDPSARSGPTAFQAFRRSMEAGNGSLDVVDLAVDTVDALARLLSAPLMYTGLLGRFINFDALLGHLNEEKVDGAVVVVGADDIGVVLLSQGQVLGAFTRSNPALSTATSGVARIAGEKTARIEVNSGAGTVSPIDFESALSRGY
ncbi:MAG: DUF4388 domain-containing protein [Candidatus Dormibacteria bacterium]